MASSNVFRRDASKELTFTMEKLKRNSVFYNEVVNKGIYYEAA